MKYKILAIILAIAIAVSGFSIKTSAVEPITATIIAMILGSVASGMIVSLTDKASEALANSNSNSDTVSSVRYTTQQMCSENVEKIISTNGVSVVYDSGSDSYYASYDSSLTGNDLELAKTIAGTVNSIPDFSNKCKLYADPISTAIDCYFYEDLKTAVGQATAEFTHKIFTENAKENGLTLIENGALPVYNFDFVGPMQPGLDLPTMATTADKFLLDGFTLTRPVSESEYTNDYVKSIGFENGKGNFSQVNYQCSGAYVLYNGEIFTTILNQTQHSSGIGMREPSIAYNTGSFFNSKGERLCDVAGFTPADWVYNYLKVGFVLSTDSNMAYKNPNTSISSSVDENSFTTSVTPGTVSIPRTEGEQAVANGLNTGIISSNPQLVLDENGNIARIDGIDTAKLLELLQTIANNGNISFDSIEGYLEHITHLLTVSNADANTLNTVVTNLNELAKSQTKSISDINTAVQAIAKAFEKTEEGEKADTDFSGLVIEHTGLVEATAIVEGMPIVQQCRQLLDNLFQSYGGTTSNNSNNNTPNNTNKAPNFAFYWDSNKDGKKERYNVLDLSFMEYQLSNENLEDKGRFNGGFTVRHFIQYLIILLCYVAFSIKILKKLPSLIGGAGEASDDLKTMDRFG